MLENHGPSSLKALLAKLEKSDVGAVHIVGHESCASLKGAVTGGEPDLAAALEAYLPDFIPEMQRIYSLSSTRNSTLAGHWSSSQMTPFGQKLLEAIFDKNSGIFGQRLSPERMALELGRYLARLNVIVLADGVQKWWQENGSGPLVVTGGTWKEKGVPSPRWKQGGKNGRNLMMGEVKEGVPTIEIERHHVAVP